MQTQVSEARRQHERQRLARHVQSKEKKDNAQPKLDRLHWVLKYHGLTPESAELKRAEKCIQAYDLEAITKTEKAFLRAVSRDPGRLNLSYFFGILKNIQQEIDDRSIKTTAAAIITMSSFWSSTDTRLNSRPRNKSPGGWKISLT